LDRNDGRASEAVRVAYVYLLRCADGSLYCGWTTDPERRLRQHNAGVASKYTQRRRPVEYAVLMEAADRSAALREEARIKRLSRHEELALVEKSLWEQAALPGTTSPNPQPA
jgi:putative endonuclease